MLTKDDLKAIVDAVSSLIDARARTTETLIKGEITAAKNELRTDLKTEIKASEERTKAELRAEFLAVRAEAKADILNLSSKVLKRENEQDKRLDALENEAGVSNPNKN